MHATDPATVFLSVAARSDTTTVAGIEAAMYETRSIERVLGMRRTLFVVQPELRPLIQVACTDKIAVTENRRLVKMMADSGVGGADPEAHLAAVKAAVLDALRSGGPSLGWELAEAVPELREKVTAGSGSSCQGSIS